MLKKLLLIISTALALLPIGVAPSFKQVEYFEPGAYYTGSADGQDITYEKLFAQYYADSVATHSYCSIGVGSPTDVTFAQANGTLQHMVPVEGGGTLDLITKNEVPIVAPVSNTWLLTAPADSELASTLLIRFLYENHLYDVQLSGLSRWYCCDILQSGGSVHKYEPGKSLVSGEHKWNKGQIIAYGSPTTKAVITKYDSATNTDNGEVISYSDLFGAVTTEPETNDDTLGEAADSERSITISEEE